MCTLGFQVLFEAGRTLIAGVSGCPPSLPLSLCMSGGEPEKSGRPSLAYISPLMLLREQQVQVCHPGVPIACCSSTTKHRNRVPPPQQFLLLIHPHPHRPIPPHPLQHTGAPHLESTWPWLVAVMGIATVVKLALFLFCSSFRNDIVQAYATDHFFDVVTNTIGLAAALLGQAFAWWVDPAGAILVRMGWDGMGWVGRHVF